MIDADFQANEIRKLIRQIHLKDGEPAFVISRAWLDQWKKFSGFQSKLRVDTPPGKIDNSNILDENGKIKKNLKQSQDYEILSGPVYKLLFQWYSGGPTIMVDVGYDPIKKICIPEVYPLSLRIHFTEANTEKVFEFSKFKKVSELKELVCEEFNISPKEYRLRDYWGKKPGSLIYEMHTLAEMMLMDGHDLLLEKMGAGASAVPGNAVTTLLAPLKMENLQVGRSDDQPLTLQRASSFEKLNLGNQQQQTQSNANVPLKLPVGLQNIGNSCYFNAALQCLCRSRDFVDYFTQDVGTQLGMILTGANLLSNDLVSAFTTFVQKLLSTRGASSFMPRDLKTAFGKYVPQFSGYGQEDAQEFLTFFLDILNDDLKNRKANQQENEENDAKNNEQNNQKTESLHKRHKRRSHKGGNKRKLSTIDEESSEIIVETSESCNDDESENSLIISDEIHPPINNDEEKIANEAWNDFHVRNSNLIIDNFYGQLRQSLKCLTCERTFISFTPFSFMSVPVPCADDVVPTFIFVPMDPRKNRKQLRLPQPVTGFAIESLIKKELRKDRVQLIYAQIPIDECELPDSDNEDSPPTTNKKPKNSKKKKSTVKKSIEFIKDPKKDLSSGHKLFVFEVENRPNHINVLVDLCVKQPTKSLKKETYFIVDSPFLINVNEQSTIGSFRLACENYFSYALEKIARRTKKLIRVQSSSSTASNVDASSVSNHNSDNDDGFNTISYSVDDISRVASINGNKSLKRLKSAKYATISPNRIEVDIKKTGFFSRSASSSNSLSSTSQDLFKPHPKIPFVSKTTAKACLNMFLLDPKGEYDLKQLRRGIDVMTTFRGKEGKVEIPLSHCIGLFEDPIILENENAWECPYCKEKVVAEQQISCWKPPKYLMIHLKRFVNSKGSSRKVDTNVLYPSELDLSPFITGPERGEQLPYKLYAVCEHNGTMGSGHYIARAFDQNRKKWYLFNDSAVRECSEDAVHSQSAYILFYEKVSHEDEDTTTESHEENTAQRASQENA